MVFCGSVSYPSRAYETRYTYMAIDIYLSFFLCVFPFFFFSVLSFMCIYIIVVYIYMYFFLSLCSNRCGKTIAVRIHSVKQVPSTQKSFGRKPGYNVKTRFCVLLFCFFFFFLFFCFVLLFFFFFLFQTPIKNRS